MLGPVYKKLYWSELPAGDVWSAMLFSRPATYFATLPVRALVGELSRCGLTARLSQDAGTFVCNDVFYRTMHLCASLPTAPLAGFVHIPYVREMPESTSVSPELDALETGFRDALAALLR